MRILTKSSLALISVAASITSITFFLPQQSPTNDAPPARSEGPKIQVAILLDVSGSMSGLIEQAKAQLWNMVNVMGRARCENYNTPPQVEIALYEYGRDDNGARQGYIRQLSPFTTDLDAVSQTLFSLYTNGSDEYCGQVIYTSLQDLAWDTASNNYKVIFIAGNEDFLQGPVHFSKACAEARKKGVVVNTIYCGDRITGIREHWNLGSECGAGSFTNIDHNAGLEEIATPYDSLLYTLNGQLNGTYIAYGIKGKDYQARQEEVDQKNFGLNKKAAYERTAAKGNKNLYRNSGWDLVDAYTDDKEVVKKIDTKTLPDSLKQKSAAEIEAVVKSTLQERERIQKDITELNKKRQDYIAKERSNKSSTAATLESEIEKIVRQQAKLFKMHIN